MEGWEEEKKGDKIEYMSLSVAGDVEKEWEEDDKKDIAIANEISKK